MEGGGTKALVEDDDWIVSSPLAPAVSSDLLFERGASRKACLKTLMGRMEDRCEHEGIAPAPISHDGTIYGYS